MTGAETALIIVGANVVGQGLIWTLVFRAMRKARERQQPIMEEALQQRRRDGERVVAGPTFGAFRRGFQRRFATLAITDNNLVLVYKDRVELVALKPMTGEPRATRWYKGNRRAGRTYVVLPLAEGEIALLLKHDEHDDFLRAVQRP